MTAEAARLAPLWPLTPSVVGVRAGCGVEGRTVSLIERWAAAAAGMIAARFGRPDRNEDVIGEPDGLRSGRDVAEFLLTDGEHRTRFVAYARVRFGIGPEDAEDLIQETVLELIRVEKLVHSPAGLAFQIFHRHCCRHLTRSRRARHTPLNEQSPEMETVPEVERTDSLVLLRQGFERISVSCRQLLTAYYLEGKSLKETADEMSLASCGVWTLVNRCIQKLRVCLGRK